MEIINRLKQLNLSITTDEEINTIFSLFPDLYIDTLILPKGLVINRYRDNETLPSGLPKLIGHVDEISYRKDTSKINKYGRCNLKQQSLFYGTVSLEENGELEKQKQPEVRGLALFEVLNSPIPPIIDNQLKIKYFTIGQWVLHEPIQVLIIHQHVNFHEKAPFLKKFYDNYIRKVKSLFPDSADVHIQMNGFFAEEFAKYVNNNDNGYKLTSNFFNNLINAASFMGKKIDGIIYPSAKSQGEGGFNIALFPYVIDSGKLKFRVASTDKVYQYNNRVIPIPEFFCKEIINDEMKWITSSEAGENNPSEEAILSHLGLTK